MSVLFCTRVEYSSVPSEAYQNLPKNADNLRTGQSSRNLLRCCWTTVRQSDKFCRTEKKNGRQKKQGSTLFDYWSFYVNRNNVVTHPGPQLELPS